MKKIKLSIISVFVIAIIAVNISIIERNSNSFGKISLSSLKLALANDSEIPDIICNTGGEGLCYFDVPIRLVMCGEYSAWETGCEATGDPDNFCEPYFPC